VAADSDLLFSVLDIGGGKTVQQVPGPHPDNNKPYLLAVSPDQSVTAMITGAEVALRLYSSDDFRLLAILSDSGSMSTGAINYVTFATDSKTLAIARSDGSVAVYDRFTK
jgi:WD40 repeat protein